VSEDDTGVTAKIDRVQPFGDRVLLVIDGAALQVLPLPANGTITIGRGGKCDVVIDSASVSRHHATLRLGPKLELEDVGSSNGTYVEGAKLAAHHPAPVEIGVPFMLGTVAVMVQTREGARQDSVMTPLPQPLPMPPAGALPMPPAGALPMPPRIPTTPVPGGQPAGSSPPPRPSQMSRMRSTTVPPPPGIVARPGDMPAQVRATIAELERQRILDALDRCAGNQTRAAELLGISRRTLINRLDEYGIARPRKRDE
jgi:predicted DNA-binding protein (UPF0251 family)